MPSVVVATTHQADDQRIVHKQAGDLLDAGVDLRLVARDGARPPSSVPYTSVEGDISTFRSRLRLAQTILAEALALVPDVLHVHDPELLIALRTLRFRGSAPKIVFDAHENYDLKFAALLGRRTSNGVVQRVAPKFYWQLERSLLRGVDAVCVVVPRQVEHYMSMGFGPAGADRPVVLVPNLPLERQFGATPVPTFEDRTVDLIHVGSLTPERGLDIIAAIYRGVRARLGPSFAGVVVNRTYVDRFDADIERSVGGSQSAIESRPAVPYAEMPYVLGLAKVVVNPIQDMGQNRFIYPTKMFEAFMRGTPVVSSDVGYMRAIAQQSGTPGVAPADVGAYVEAICGLVADADAWREASDSARAMIQDNGLTWERTCTPRMADLYDRLLP